ncbi:MAG: helix-turn-helix domain-containing protein [Lachnospiraceae bacterium]|nr:helix-turn-helix domain-containing protein [Lachnospiraceae bacterium]
MMDTDCFSDIVACVEMAIVIMWDKLTEDDKGLLIEFYTEIAPFSETMILIGEPDIPDDLRKEVSIYPGFEEFSVNAKYVLLGAYRRSKKSVNFSIALANSIMILSLMRKKPYVTTKELAGKLELSERTVRGILRPCVWRENGLNMTFLIKDEPCRKENPYYGAIYDGENSFETEDTDCPKQELHMEEILDIREGLNHE